MKHGIQLENLSKTFGRLNAVQDLNLDIAPGEFFAFLGPNAAGKTTTIKMLATRQASRVRLAFAKCLFGLTVIALTSAVFVVCWLALPALR